MSYSEYLSFLDDRSKESQYNDALHKKMNWAKQLKQNIEQNQAVLQKFPKLIQYYNQFVCNATLHATDLTQPQGTVIYAESIAKEINWEALNNLHTWIADFNLKPNVHPFFKKKALNLYANLQRTIEIEKERDTILNKVVDYGKGLKRIQDFKMELNKRGNIPAELKTIFERKLQELAEPSDLPNSIDQYISQYALNLEYSIQSYSEAIELEKHLATFPNTAYKNEAIALLNDYKKDKICVTESMYRKFKEARKEVIEYMQKYNAFARELSYFRNFQYAPSLTFPNDVMPQDLISHFEYQFQKRQYIAIATIDATMPKIAKKLKVLEVAATEWLRKKKALEVEATQSKTGYIGAFILFGLSVIFFLMLSSSRQSDTIAWLFVISVSSTLAMFVRTFFGGSTIKDRLEKLELEKIINLNQSIR
jgi:hypothetical protein